MVAARDLDEAYILDQRENRQVPIEVVVLSIAYYLGGERDSGPGAANGGITCGLPPQPPVTLDLRLDFHRVIAAGLAIAGATGLGAGFFGSPFLTSTHGHVHVPLVGDLHLASAALFDLGVYLVVVGVVVLILEELGRLTPGRAGVG